jgi:hypothetical protein
MSKEDKSKLDGIAAGAQVNVSPPVFSNSARTTPGLVPAGSGSGETKFLREDASWQEVDFSALSASIAAKYTKPSSGIPVSDLALTTAQRGALNSGITSELVEAIGDGVSHLFADDADSAQEMSEDDPDALVFYPGGDGAASVEVDNVTLGFDDQGKLEVQDGGIGNAKLGYMDAGTIKGAVVAGAPSDLTVEQARSVLGIRVISSLVTEDIEIEDLQNRINYYKDFEINSVVTLNVSSGPEVVAMSSIIIPVLRGSGSFRIIGEGESESDYPSVVLFDFWGAACCVEVAKFNIGFIPNVFPKISLRGFFSGLYIHDIVSNYEVSPPSSGAFFLIAGEQSSGKVFISSCKISGFHCVLSLTYSSVDVVFSNNTSDLAFSENVYDYFFTAGGSVHVSGSEPAVTNRTLEGGNNGGFLIRGAKFPVPNLFAEDEAEAEALSVSNPDALVFYQEE